MLYWDLFFVFFKIGLFSFGGGFAMIAIIQQEVINHGWLTAAEYANVITISQMTPGPVAINTATYVGAKVGGPEFATAILGSLIATLGVSLPSFVLVSIVAGSFKKFRSAPQVQWVLGGIRPAVIAFMCTAVLFFVKLTFFPAPNNTTFSNLFSYFDPLAVLLASLLFYLYNYRNIGAIPLILIAGAIGLLM